MSQGQNRDRAPLAERMRPARLEEVVGQEHVLGQDALLPRALASGRVFSVIFWGPPGSGKTTLARLVSQYTQYPFRAFSAVTSGVKELRQVVEEAQGIRTLTGKPTILFVDEIHRFNKAQQDAFLPHVESGLILLIGATTQNPSFEVIPPLLSRTRVMVLRPLGHEALQEILIRAIRDPDRGLGALGVQVASEALEAIAHFSGGDARMALNHLEEAIHYALAAQKGIGPLTLDLATLQKALGRKSLPYDKDGEEHYNLISAFIKSLRGSDAQACLYWLYRMLGAGEDPLFIGRRMIRFAAEDVGLADPGALSIANDAFEAFQKVGPPEGELTLAEAAVYLASAPKSNALYLAEKAVKEEIENSGAIPVPMHIRNAPTALMRQLGYARGYLYPHNYPGAWVDQAYLPEEIRGRVFYRPKERGFEATVKRRIDNRKGSRKEE